jgi:hypothetical protein
MKRKNRSLFLIVAVLTALQFAGGSTFANADDGGNAQLRVWGTYSLAKVLKNPEYNHNNAQLAAKLDVSAANGETESGQIIITTGDVGVKEYTVETVDLTNENGDVYAAENVSVFNQWYVLVKEKTFGMDLNADYFPAQDANGPATSGYTPDALIPQAYSEAFKENHIDPNSNQGITFDFKVPTGTPAGTYTGEFTLKIDGAAHTIPVTLNVWGFDVSQTHGMNLWDIGEKFDAPGEMTTDYQSTYYKYYDALLDYKLNGYHLYEYDDNEITWVKDLRKYAQDPAFNGVFLPDIGSKRTPMYRYFAEILKACIEDEINYFAEIRFYHQSVDEPQHRPGALDDCREIAEKTNVILQDIAADLQAGILADSEGNLLSGFDQLSETLKAAIVSGIIDMPQVVTTYYDASEDLQGLVSSYCPKISFYETDRERRLYENNAEITDGEQWFYTCLNPQYPYPSNHVDDFLHGFRIMSWMKKEYGVYGYLNWMCNMQYGMDGGDSDFTNNMVIIDPYEDPLRFHDGYNGANGDGYMFYPMAKYKADSPLPSVRLLTARDGQEDYDTLWTLEERYAKIASGYDCDASSTVKNLDEALSVYYEMLYNDTYAYNDDWNFERVRRAIGGLTEAACNASETMILQQKLEGGASAALKIYSKADKVWVNGNALTKAGSCYVYAGKLEAGKNSVELRYEIDGKTYAFEYFLASQTTNYPVAAMSSASTIATGSTISVVDDTLDIKAVSYGGSNAKKLDFMLPIDADFTSVHNLSFTIKNTCAEQIEFEVYIKGSNANVLADKVIVFPYETYAYSLNYLYEKAAKAGSGVNGITLRFTNYAKDDFGNMVALPERTLKLYGFSYSLK